MHKVFISYHHSNDQYYKEELLKINTVNNVFIDGSVDTGDIDENLEDQQIREIIRDDYLKDTTVTIVLVGEETKNRKHIDWEIYSSMYDGKKNSKSGILVVNLPLVESTNLTVSHSGEKERLYSEIKDWVTVDNKNDYQKRYPKMPDRIIDNIMKKEVNISVANWSKISTDIDALRFLIDATCEDKDECEYDLSQPMRRNNS